MTDIRSTNEAELRSRFPDIHWDEPIKVEVGQVERLGCRYCIALVGLKGNEAGMLPRTPEQFTIHLREMHHRPEPPGPQAA